MSSEPIPFDAASHAIFTICATQDVTMALAAVAAETPGVSFAGQFESYFSGDSRPQFSAALKSVPGAIAIVDCDGEPEQALETMTRLRQMGFKSLNVIGLATALADGYLLRAMRAGCNEFLTKPLDGSHLSEALLGFQRVQVADVDSMPGAGSVLSIFGVKGGVGATTLAVHLANELVCRRRKRVLLIDHHYELGHVALHLGMKDGQYHFNDLIRNVHRLDSELLNGLVARHRGGVDILSSPDACSEPYPTTSEDVQRVFQFLRRQYDFVVVDSSMSYIDVVPAILQASDETYLVSTGDVASLRDLARRVDKLRQMEGLAGKLRIIINRSTAMDAVSVEQIASAIHFPVWLSVPNLYLELQRALNAGEPIGAQNRSGFTQGIAKWAQQLLGDAPQEPKATRTRPAKKLLFWRSQPSTS